MKKRCYNKTYSFDSIKNILSFPWDDFSVV